MISETMQTTLKTAVLVVAVTASFIAFLVLQIEALIGPAGAMTRVVAGSPEWFAAAGRLVTTGTYIVWPLLIFTGAALQRLWCPRSPLWVAAFIPLPAVILKFSTSISDVLVCLAYVAVAVLAGAIVKRGTGRRRSLEGEEPS